MGKGSCSTKQQITTSPLGSEKASSKLKKPFSLSIPIQPTTPLRRDSNNPQLQDIERGYFSWVLQRFHIVFEPKQFQTDLLRISSLLLPHKKAYNQWSSQFLKQTCFILEGDPYRKRPEVMKPLRWEVISSFVGVSRLGLQSYEIIIFCTIWILSPRHKVGSHKLITSSIKQLCNKNLALALVIRASLFFIITTKVSFFIFA